MEREGEREEGAGGDNIILHFLAVRSRTGARRTKAREGREEDEGTDRGKAVVRAQTRMDPLLFHSPQRKEDQEHFGPHGQG